MAKWFSGLFGKNKEAEAPTQWVTPASGGKHAANASDDDKTIVVGSRSPGNKIGPGKIARSSVDERKTEIAGGAPAAAPEPRVARSDATAGAIRAKPSPRLSWPARDAQGSSSWPTENSEMDKSKSQAGGDETIFPADTSFGAPRIAQNDERTRLFKAPLATPADNSSIPTDASSTGQQPNRVNSLEDPVVGWFVVLDGPGKGRSIEIGIGANSIGRDRGQKICLGFGDDRISRDRHAVLVFDPLSRKYFLQAGEVRNLTYVAKEVVLGPVELKGGETITIGDTQLRFVPLCGPDFGWS